MQMTPFLSIFPLLPYIQVPEYNFTWQDSGFLAARFNADGSLDTSFQSSPLSNIPGLQVGSLAGGAVGGVTIQADGKIVIAGAVGGFGSSSAVVVRLNANGELDTTFNAGGNQPGVATTAFANNPIPYYLNNQFIVPYPSDYFLTTSVVIQGDGKIVVGAADYTHGLIALRYNTDGTADAGFGSNGVVTYASLPGTLAYLNGLVVEPDGKILEAGAIASSDPGPNFGPPVGGLLMVHFNADGTMDSSFGQNGVVLFATADAQLGPYSVDLLVPYADGETGPVESGLTWGSTAGMIVQADGKIVVTGAAFADQEAQNGSEWLVTRFNPGGTLDESFGNGGIDLITFGISGAVAGPTDIAAGPNGGFIIAGSISGTALTPSVMSSFVLLEFGGEVPMMTPSAPPVTPAVVLGTISPSEAVFASLAMGSGNTGTAVFPTPLATNPVSVVIPTPSITASLPIPTESQSAAVARLSGGGGGSIATDDPLGLTGDPDRMGSFVFAGSADASEQ
jgi:uncharacterized delta-60 repeat protein